MFPAGIASVSRRCPARCRPFTAPAVSPATKYRCRPKNTAITGSETMTEEAMNSP